MELEIVSLIAVETVVAHSDKFARGMGPRKSVIEANVTYPVVPLYVVFAS